MFEPLSRRGLIPVFRRAARLRVHLFGEARSLGAGLFAQAVWTGPL